MKKLLFPLLALGLLSLAPVRADEHTPLGEQMEALDDAYKAFRRTDDPAEGAKLARVAQESVLKAFTLTPELVEEGAHPEGKEVAMAEYRAQMAQLLVTLCEVEKAFVAKDLDKVQELIQPIKDSKKKGHDGYMEDE